MGGEKLTREFRKYSFDRRAAEVQKLYGYAAQGEGGGSPREADRLIEQAIGFFRVPLGVGGPLVVNGTSYHIPIATEEPSVVAALTYGGAIINRNGGVQVSVPGNRVVGQVVLTGVGAQGFARITEHKETLSDYIRSQVHSLAERGGGFVGMEISRPPAGGGEAGEDGGGGSDSAEVLVEFTIDVCDAQGANRINTLAEAVGHEAVGICGGSKLLAILSNSGADAVVTATIKLAQAGGTAERIAAASGFAQRNRRRAVTHNKGIMNAVTAVALATGNDTRAVEAAAHEYAAREGGYKPLSRYWVEGDCLYGELKMPVALATVGGSVGVTGDSASMLRLLGVERAGDLRAVAAAAGLAQNYAALLALVTTGIQRGHMAMHARRSPPPVARKNDSTGEPPATPHD